MFSFSAAGNQLSLGLGTTASRDKQKAPQLQRNRAIDSTSLAMQQLCLNVDAEKVIAKF